MGVDGDVKVCAARVVVSVSPAAAVVRVSNCSVSSRRHLDIGHEVWRDLYTTMHFDNHRGIAK